MLCSALEPVVLPIFTHIMSFQDIESGTTQTLASSSRAPHKREEAEKPFLTLQHSLSLQIFKINANVQGILKLVDQLGTPRDSSSLRKSLCVPSLIN
jgi:syntaxin 7